MNTMRGDAGPAQERADDEQREAAEVIRAWRERTQADRSLTIDDLPPEMTTPEVREQIAAMSDEDRALTLFIGYAASRMSPDELKAVGITMVDQAECGDVR